MAKLIDWIRRASVQLLDPQREERIDYFARNVASRLKSDRGAFNFDALVTSLEIQPRDIPLVQERVYEFACKKAWRDRQISEEEKKGLDWVARSVMLPEKNAEQVAFRVGLEVFQEVLSDAVADGRIEPAELEELQQVAACIGTSVRDLVTRYFSDWAEGFLRAMFMKMIEDGELSHREWSHLVASAEAIGLKENELLDSIRVQAERFVEHVLIDAKADGQLSEEEESTLAFLMERLKLSPRFRTYAEGEIRELKQITDILKGRLPSLNVHLTGRRNTEIVHFEGPGSYEEVKHLKSGQQRVLHEGRVLITNCRLIFESPARTFDLNHRRVTRIAPRGDTLELSATGRGNGRYTFGSDSKLAFLIYEAAVRKANQTLVEQVDGLPTRHIPRDVRQRVYQKYGGRCAECGSNQYLEFDHIIPVTKGGSNSEQNVQLLCRRCNLKKSDKI
ncbi:MAG TPA: HNH endonuclease signature motif containing protein [Phycisphaerae bacterium]|nr:HNH endonuclease signature motif containing protein [Phycisphaerae bacterium]